MSNEPGRDAFYPDNKVLPMKLELYLESVGRTVRDYDFVGVHSRSFERFLGKIPGSTERVVEYHVVTIGDTAKHTGLALILRKTN